MIAKGMGISVDLGKPLKNSRKKRKSIKEGALPALTLKKLRKAKLPRGIEGRHHDTILIDDIKPPEAGIRFTVSDLTKIKYHLNKLLKLLSKTSFQHNAFSLLFHEGLRASSNAAYMNQPSEYKKFVKVRGVKGERRRRLL